MPEMTLSEAAKWAGVTRATIHKALRGGRLSGRKDDAGEWRIDPAELERIRQRESDITKERIGKILGAGANVVLTTKGIDDMSLKYFVEAGAIACRRVPKDDLRWACRHAAPASSLRAH